MNAWLAWIGRLIGVVWAVVAFGWAVRYATEIIRADTLFSKAGLVAGAMIVFNVMLAWSNFHNSNHLIDKETPK